MRNYPGIEKRINILLEKKNYFYLAFYEDYAQQSRHLVGTFTLTPTSVNEDKEKFFSRKKYHVVRVPNIKTINLSYFYVHDNFREHGFGTQMLEKAKQIAKASEMVMTAHLLTPNVHGFYTKRDAVVLAEDRSLNEPCVLVRFK
jgi:GNAT superfamily N-acetyltransferase